MLDFGFVILGLVILVLAGDALVRGAVGLSLRLGVPALIVSLTIVAIGTSAPELLISVSAVSEGAPGIAIGNVVGSNTANILLVLGLPALMAGLATGDCDTRASYMQMLVATLVFVVAAIFSPITWGWGLALTAVFALFMAQAIFSASQHRRNAVAIDAADDGEIEGVDPPASGWRIALLIVLGLIGLPVGADLLVSGATNIARAYAVPETVIGLTLVAVGTSLPELATTVSAAMRKQADVALGNVIGSNMANLLAIVGIAALFGPIPVSAQFLRFDVVIMVLASLAIAPFVFGRFNLTRAWGALFVAAYVGYVLVVLLWETA